MIELAMSMAVAYKMLASLKSVQIPMLTKALDMIILYFTGYFSVSTQMEYLI